VPPARRAPQARRARVAVLTRRGRSTQVIGNFTITSFEGKSAVFELPEQNLEDDVMYPDDPVRPTPLPPVQSGHVSSIPPY
jgi:hypothetical protein